MLIQLLRNAQLLLKQNVTNANHTVQHTISSPRSGIYQCIARNEYGSKQSSLYATVSGVVPTVSVTSRSSTTADKSPSMPQSTDYVTISQSIPRAPSTSTSSSYSSQLTNATSHNVQSTSGMKSPRVTSAPVTVTQANASSVSLSSSSSTLNLPTTSTLRTSSSSQRSDLIPTTSTVLPTSQTASPPSHHTNTPSSSGASKSPSGKVTNAATTGDASKSTTRPATKTKTPTPAKESDGLPIAVVVGGAAGGVVVLIVFLIIIIVTCYRRFALEEDKQRSPVASATTIDNPTYWTATTNREKLKQSHVDSSGETAASSSCEDINKPTAIVSPVQRSTATEDNGIRKEDQYDVLDRKADDEVIVTKHDGLDKRYSKLEYSKYNVCDRKRHEIPVTTGGVPLGGYSVVKRMSDKRQKNADSSRSDGQYEKAVISGAYELVGRAKNPSSNVQTQSDLEEDTPYAVPDKPKQAVSAHLSASSTDGRHSEVTAKKPKQLTQRLSTTSASEPYEEVVQSGSTKEENPYSLPSDHKAKARKNTVSPKTEYSYAKPDSKRATTVESDRLVIGEVTTTKQDDEERPQGNSENPYAAPDEVKHKNARSVTLPSEYFYAKPNVKREMEISGDRLLTRAATMMAQQDDTGSKPNDKNDENPYGLPDENKTRTTRNAPPSLPPPNAQDSRTQPEQYDQSNADISAGKSDSSISPSQFTAVKDTYAVANKQSKKKQSTVSHMSVGDSEYAVANIQAKRKQSTVSHMSVGDSEYAVANIQAKKKQSTVSLRSFGDSEYAVSSKLPSGSPKSNRKPAVASKPKHYQTEGTEYAVSAKSRSLPRNAMNATASSVQKNGNSDVKYTDVEITSSETKRHVTSEGNVEYATIDHTKH
ncbi:mucin-2-like isoform X2 [Corticium candelabrum]|uniref:mucin-2-like isoform X2 n=1 Tax=Corticium candelabrum TaxID=121492 RepID=UPI002E255004|nr:mucin-2-like isoform X2 [Corticium candelabrum]